MHEERELQAKIDELREEFGGLLEDEVLRKIAMDEVGKLNHKTIAEFKDKDEVSTEVIISSISDIREFIRRDGEVGQVRNLIVEDDTGSCRLTLWDEDVYLPDEEGWQPGEKLRLINCYVKFTDYGTDLTKGKIGTIEKVLPLQ